MYQPRSMAMGVSVVLALLALGELVVGGTQLLHNGLAPSAQMAWSLSTAMLLAAASVGMFLRRTVGWYLGLFATAVFAGQWLEEVVAGSRLAILADVLTVGVVLAMIRASGWFPGAHSLRGRGRGGYGAPLDASP